MASCSPKPSRRFYRAALIEAHMYGKVLDWDRCYLEPSVEERLKRDSPLEKRVNCRKVRDRDILRRAPVVYLYAFAFNNETVRQKPISDSVACHEDRCAS